MIPEFKGRRAEVRNGILAVRIHQNVVLVDLEHPDNDIPAGGGDKPRVYLQNVIISVELADVLEVHPNGHPQPVQVQEFVVGFGNLPENLHKAGTMDQGIRAVGPQGLDDIKALHRPVLVHHFGLEIHPFDSDLDRPVIPGGHRIRVIQYAKHVRPPSSHRCRSRPRTPRPRCLPSAHNPF